MVGHRELTLARILVAVVITSATACTYFEVPAVGSAPKVIANTLEWFGSEPSALWQPRTYRRGEHHGASCEGGLAWTGQIGFLAMQYSVLPIPTDFMNEAGLTVSEHALRGVGTFIPANATKTICTLDLATWMATTFRTVKEIVSILPSTAVLALGSGTTSLPGMQWAVADASGDSIVVDYVDGILHVYNNSGVGVLTNDPPYDWQLRNLNNYVGLNMGWPSGNDDIRVDSDIGSVPVAVGHGQNMLGLPGDLSPPSRFVRTFFTRSYALKANPPATLDAALVLASGVLNTQQIVKGMNAKLPAELGYDFTQFCTLKVPSERLFYYRTYENSQWRRINISALSFVHGATSQTSTLGFGAVDVTEELHVHSHPTV